MGANTGDYSRLVKITAGVLVVATLAWSVIYVMSVATRLGIVVGSMQYVALGASLLLPQAFLLFRANDKRPKGNIPWYDLLAAIMAFAIPLYVFATYGQARSGGWGIHPPTEAIILGVAMILLVIEGARRTGGTFFVVAVVICASLPLVAQYLPGFLKSLPIQPNRAVGNMFLTSEGMFGSVMQVFVQVFLLFIFFGVLIQVGGGGKFFINLAMSFMGHTTGGAAKVAVISSSLFGTISGSATANVSVCGAFTIPMMKEAGYKPHFAAAVEAAASEGGAIMPPVMGAIAFLMANFLGIPYWRVALAAIVPALIYYWCLFSQVHFHAVNHNLIGVPKGELPSAKKTLIEGYHIVATLVILIWLLFIEKLTPGKAVMFTSIAYIVLCCLRKSTRPTKETLKAMLQNSARIFGQLSAILLAIGIIVAGIGLSGIDMSTAQWLGNGTHSVWVGLLALCAAAFVLGTGMPGSAIYLLLAILMAPALVTFGLSLLAVHMTILYWGLIADFTPPTAVAPTVAAGYAGANPLKTQWQTMRLGAVIFIAPFFFVFHPVILFENFQLAEFVWVVASAAIGFWLVARGFEGYEPGSRAKIARRVLALAAGVMILSMTWWAQVVGIVLAAGLEVFARRGKVTVPSQGRSGHPAQKTE
ncbi:MAG: TRAP transporter fused permease subunit [Dehalococcoidia bacterium]|nr:TRAP transporter fused permease subunit [Dehalococcoidia bacterium]